MFILRVDHKSPEAPARVTVGIRVRETCPRNTVEVPTVYREFEYDAKGQPVMGQEVRFEGSGATQFRTVTREHKYHRENKVYTVQKTAYKYQKLEGQPIGGRVVMNQPIRFINMVRPVAEALIASHGNYLDIRFASTQEEYIVAKSQVGSSEVEREMTRISALDGTARKATVQRGVVEPDAAWKKSHTKSAALTGDTITLPNGKKVVAQSLKDFDSEDANEAAPVAAGAK